MAFVVPAPSPVNGVVFFSVTSGASASAAVVPRHRSRGARGAEPTVQDSPFSRGRNRPETRVGHSDRVIMSGDIGSIARWLVARLAAQGYGRDEVVELATALLGEVGDQLAEANGRAAVAELHDRAA
jgi:hypothetical protein